ncbi:Orexin receptor type 1 [Eumeta japonica]|uniref:Orexin receptor type 1 n=1 Tax=Eumeta variegata TaxID=151549 RepID=A0A4C1W7L1_EUMVA|nr:Orexin receptor type 1 [Eumeta japonica]
MNESLDESLEIWKNFLDETMKPKSYVLSAILWLLMVVTFIISVVGNSLTCIVIYKDRTMRNVTNLYLFNLALSDLSATLGIPVALVYQIGNWTGNAMIGSVLCKAQGKPDCWSDDACRGDGSPRCTRLWCILMHATFVNSWLSMAVNPVLFSLVSSKFRSSLKVRRLDQVVASPGQASQSQDVLSPT